MGRKSLKPIRQKGIIKAFYKVAQKEGLENASIKSRRRFGCESEPCDPLF
jgi:hypothetical protein